MGLFVIQESSYERKGSDMERIVPLCMIHILRSSRLRMGTIAP
jgi:hypothetical protein